MIAAILKLRILSVKLPMPTGLNIASVFDAFGVFPGCPLGFGSSAPMCTRLFSETARWVIVPDRLR